MMELSVPRTKTSLDKFPPPSRGHLPGSTSHARPFHMLHAHVIAHMRPLTHLDPLFLSTPSTVPTIQSQNHSAVSCYWTPDPMVNVAQRRHLCTMTSMITLQTYCPAATLSHLWINLAMISPVPSPLPHLALSRIPLRDASFGSSVA